MSIIQIPQRFSQRWDTAANWTAKNSILWVGEIGFESDTPNWKRGDGVTAWNALAYSNGNDITGANEQSGTSYALVLADAARMIRLTNVAAITLTIPKSTSVALPLYRAIPVFQGGAGIVTISGAAGVTLEAPFGAATTTQGDFRTLFQRATDVWVIG